MKTKLIIQNLSVSFMVNLEILLKHEYSTKVEETKNKILEEIERDTSITADQKYKRSDC